MTIRRGYVELPAECGEGRQLHYRRAGRIGAPTLILLHQTPSHSAMYAPLMAALQDDFETLALDTPGFGQSDPLPESFSIVAAGEALAAAVAQLQVGACFWFGHHTGAALALQIAHSHPEQVAALALSGPCLLDQSLRERLPVLAAPLPVETDGRHLSALWARMQAKDETAGAAIWQRETLEAAAAGAAYPAAYRAVLEVDTAAQLAALDCPSLLFAGTEDPLYPQLAAAGQLAPRARVAEIAGGRSYVCERQTEQVAGLLRDFFGGLHG